MLPGPSLQVQLPCVSRQRSRDQLSRSSLPPGFGGQRQLAFSTSGEMHIFNPCASQSGVPPVQQMKPMHQMVAASQPMQGMQQMAPAPHQMQAMQQMVPISPQMPISHQLLASHQSMQLAFLPSGPAGSDYRHGSSAESLENSDWGPHQRRPRSARLHRALRLQQQWPQV